MCFGGSSSSTPLPDPFSKVISLLYDPSNFQYPINPCSSDVFKLILTLSKTSSELRALFHILTSSILASAGSSTN